MFKNQISHKNLCFCFFLRNWKAYPHSAYIPERQELAEKLSKPWPTSWARDQHSHMSPSLRGALCWGLIALQSPLQFLITLSLNLCFGSEIRWDKKARG